MSKLCFSTYAVDMKECDASESNSTTIVAAFTRNIPRTTFGASMLPP
jgi:hypothetical protein